MWRQRNPNGWSIQQSVALTAGSTEAHQTVGRQDYGLLTKILDAQGDLVHAADENGWLPLHESAVGSSEAIVELLIERGSNVNAKTKDGRTALQLAKHYKGVDHPFVEMLEKAGATSRIKPEL